jgi:hypothetical protein
VRVLVLLAAASLLCSCTSVQGTRTIAAELTQDVQVGGEKVASASVRGAEVVGESVGTAYRGVKKGFDPPATDAYGTDPLDYVNTIRKHMLRYEGVEQTASFQFGKPARAYQNKGLLRGGEIDWQGWVVDVAVATKTPFGQPDTREYVVRLTDGDVVEVIEKAYAGAIRRVSADGSAPASPQRRGVAPSALQR